ncbi:hypothetical protein [Brevundimonas sp.]|uniref:hypothetical protein n=1 Tax=Brevundimonas sp. TaxID=1871086 RepID=UPI00391B53B0
MSFARTVGPSATLMIGNVLRIKPAATLEEARRIAPMLLDIPDADLSERMAQARRRLGIPTTDPRRRA